MSVTEEPAADYGVAPANGLSNSDACYVRNTAYIALQREFVDLARIPADWDSYGAAPADREAIAAAQALIVDVLSAFPGRAVEDLLPSDVMLLPTGAVQLVWEGADGELDLDIDAQRRIGYLLTLGTGAVRGREEKDDASPEDVVKVLTEQVGL
jgi:hypothetical protein